MNCKIKRKSWRRLAASLLAGLCLLTGSGAALAAQAAGAAATPETAQAAPDSEAVATPETATPEQVTEATPETAASAARLSFTVLDSDYQAPASGNIDESLFAIESDEARMPAGEAVPVLLQVVDPAPDSTVTVTLSEGAVFTNSEMEADDGSTYTRTFASGEQASAWMLYVRADGDFTAEATYIAPADALAANGAASESLTRTISVTRYHKISLFSAFSARAGEHQYHITDVTNVGGEWLITFEGEDQSLLPRRRDERQALGQRLLDLLRHHRPAGPGAGRRVQQQARHPAVRLGAPAGGQQQRAAPTSTRPARPGGRTS